MAVTLNARTEAIIDSILRSLGVDTLRLAEAPPNAQITGTLRAALSGGETEVTVSNGHLWPNVGRCRIVGATPEVVTYVQVLPVGRTGNKPPTYNGRGNPPEARLRLTPGTTVANAALINVPVHTPVDNAALSARSLSNGMLGTHDLLGLLRAFQEDLISPALAVVVPNGGFDEAWEIDSATPGNNVHAGPTAAINDASVNDFSPFVAADGVSGDYGLFGYAQPFGSIAFTASTPGVKGGGAPVLAWEYWNGAAWAAFTGLADTTVDFTVSPGVVSWVIPTDWTPDASTNTDIVPAGGVAGTATLRYWARVRLVSGDWDSGGTGTLPLLDQGILGGFTSVVHDTGAFIVSTHAGDTVTIVSAGSAAPEGETGTVLSNTVDYLVLSAPLTAALEVADTYTVTPGVFTRLETELEANLPVNYTNANLRGTADTSNTVNEISTTMVNALVQIIEFYGGTVPTNDATTGQLAREEDRHTRLAAPAAAADVDITVADASLLEGYTAITIGITPATILRVNSRRSGAGPQTVTLTAALGGAGEATGVVVTPNPRGTVNTGRRHIAPTPHAFGIGFRLYLDAAIAAIEAWTIPHV